MVRIYIFHGKRKYRCESLARLRFLMRGPVEKVGDIVQVVTWCRQIKKWRGNYPSLNGVLALFLEDKMTKDPWLFLEGGWKLRCESLASLRYFLHGLAERVGDIVQVVHGADKSRHGQKKTTLPLNGVEPGQGQF